MYLINSSAVEIFPGDKEFVNRFTVDNISSNESGLLVQFLESIPDSAFLLNKDTKSITFNSRIHNELNLDKIKITNGIEIGNLFEQLEKQSKLFENSNRNQFSLINLITKTLISDSDISENTTIKIEDDSHFEVFASPIKLLNVNYILFTLKDLSGIKRKEILQRTFFHDVLNTANAVNGLSELISDSNNLSEMKEYAEMLRESVDELINEITAHRAIYSAENNLLDVCFETTSVNTILRKTFDLYAKHNLAIKKKFNIEYLKKDILFQTDSTLLVRSIGNLVKNALEAGKENGTVKVFAKSRSEKIFFHVFNDEVIPDSIQELIFNKSFSTKTGTDRGVGTYSVKLLVEDYLKGRVYFISDEDVKTVFTIEFNSGTESQKNKK